VSVTLLDDSKPLLSLSIWAQWSQDKVKVALDLTGILLYHILGDPRKPGSIAESAWPGLTSGTVRPGNHSSWRTEPGPREKAHWSLALAGLAAVVSSYGTQLH
jgi:hypothetical protein